MSKAEPSPQELHEYINALSAFHKAYRAFLEGGSDDAELRGAVLATIPAAQRALTAANHHMVVADPPMTGGVTTYTGLSTIAFLHERPGFRLSEPPLYTAVIDNVVGAQAKLKDMAEQEARRRRTVTYWGDRLVRALLSIPAYIVSRVIGVSVTKVDRSAWGLPLRLLGVAADATAVYFAGRAFKLW